MFKSEVFCLVLGLFDPWSDFGDIQCHMIRYKAYQFLLMHNEDFEAYKLGCGREILDELRDASTVARRLL